MLSEGSKGNWAGAVLSDLLLREESEATWSMDSHGGLRQGSGTEEVAFSRERNRSLETIFGGEQRVQYVVDLHWQRGEGILTQALQTQALCDRLSFSPI